MNTDSQLDAWITRQLAQSKHYLALAISATALQRRRPEFGQCVVPARGSVLASPVIANWDPEPDYFFHWPRDAAAVMRGIVDLLAMSEDLAERTEWQAHFHDIVNFNLRLSEAATVQAAPNDQRGRTIASCRQFLRPRAELRQLSGDRLLAEPRFNPDGSVDFLRWSRPQLDGPALRALACLAWLHEGGERTAALVALLQRDLQFTLRQAGHRSIGPWEESHEYAHHYFVALTQLGALVQGREFAGYNPRRWQRAEALLRRQLEQHWLTPHNVFAAVRGLSAPATTPTHSDSATAAVDSAILLAIVEAALPEPLHSARDPRAVATLEALAQAFEQAFTINSTRPPGTGPALGRSLADRYFGGGAWYVTTLGAAAFCYQRALALPEETRTWLARGNSWLATVRWMTPPDGTMTEQVDRSTLEPRSAKHLSWSYAAFISTARLRQRVLQSLG